MARVPDWTLVRSFLAVARHGSLSAAARVIGVTQPTIGRHVDQLEQALGTPLFTRSPGGLIATQAARALVPHAEAMDVAVSALVRAAEAGDDAGSPRGTVRISASEIIGLTVLPPILGALRRRHPAIVLELTVNNRLDDLLRRSADIAVRMVRPRQDGLIAKRVGDLELGLFAHRDYVRQFGLPQRLDELDRFHIIGFDRDDHSARAVAEGVLPIAREMFAFRCDHDVGQLAAVRAGLGIGVVQVAIARTEPDLVPVLAESVRFSLECWLAVHEDQRALAPIRATFDALAEGLARHVRGGE